VKQVFASIPSHVDPEKEQHEQARIRAAANLRRLDKSRGDDDSDSENDRPKNGAQRPKKEDLALNQYESLIAMEVVAPEDIPVGFDGRQAGYESRGSTLTVGRYWRTRRYHRGTQGNRYLPSHHAPPVFTCISAPRSAIWCSSLWSTGMWQDDACQGIGARKRSMLYQSAHLNIDRKVVR
jgi:hypothetical protein